MTKNLLILSLFFLSVLKLNAQCTPDESIVKPGFYPKTLPEANEGEAYSEVIQFKILKDTTILLFGQPTPATIDSAHIDSVVGIPQGINFKLNKTNPTYLALEVGCALISGKPTKEGTYPIDIYLKLYGKINGFSVAQPQVIDNYTVIVNGNGSIFDIENSLATIYPNPLKKDELTLNSHLVLPGTLISIYNYQGQLVSSQVFNHQPTLPFNYPRGLYFIHLQNGDKVSKVKLIKE